MHQYEQLENMIIVLCIFLMVLITFVVIALWREIKYTKDCLELEKRMNESLTIYIERLKYELKQKSKDCKKLS